MYVKLDKNEKIDIDTNLTIEDIENSIGIKEVEQVNVQGFITPSQTSIVYNLDVITSVKLFDENNFDTKDIKLSFKINEIVDIDEENLYIEQKVLDLNAKIWENIVVEILNISSKYEMDLTTGEGWSFHQELDDDDEVDERLKPLLKLLNVNEEV